MVKPDSCKHFNGVTNTCCEAGINYRQCSPLTLPWWSLRRQHVNAVRAWAVEHRSVATGNRYLAALRGTLKECWRLDLMSIEDYHRAIDVKPIKGDKLEQAAGRALREGEKAAIIQACSADGSPAGCRDVAIFGLGIFGGLRRAEIAGLLIPGAPPPPSKRPVMPWWLR